MNVKLKETLKDFECTFGNVISGLIGCVTSILRMMLLSSILTAIRSRSYKNFRNFDMCTILANGPSLKVALEHNAVRLENTDVFCVNVFCKSEYFWKLKPRYYCLIDGAFFNPRNERCQKLADEVTNCFRNVNWDMFVILPSFIKSGSLFDVISQNPHLEVLPFNSTTVSGYTWFSFLCYQLSLGMPFCINVANFALMSAITMKYKSIYIYGIDHSWLKDLFVDENNVLCYRDSHVYNTNSNIIRNPDSCIAQKVGDVATAFRIHMQINEYAKSCGVKIYNCTKGSFVDAYERLDTKD